MAGKDLNEESTKGFKVKVDTGRLDNVLNLVGELVVLKSQLTHNQTISTTGDNQLKGIVGLIDKAVRDLQDHTLAMRMTGLNTLFGKVRHAGLDLSIQLGKRIRFEIVGDQTEIDRSLIETITDPLLHLIRNAVDHGVERPEARQNAGKTLLGRIRLLARQSNGMVQIEIEDDGRGLNRQLILEKAKLRGIQHPDPAEMSDSDVFDLIFLPGFSTVEKITEVSGRGVGLDIVKSNVERIGGQVSVESKDGKGTKFTLSVPLSTAISEGMLLSFGPKNQTFVMPVNCITEVVKLSKEQLTHLRKGSEVFHLRGKFYPVINLDRLFDMNSDLNQEGTVILVNVRGGQHALVCNSVLGRGQVVVKALGDYLTQFNGVVGGAIMGDGTVALVMDADHLVSHAFRGTA